MLLTHSAWADDAERDRVLAEVRRRVPGVPIAEASHKPVGLRKLAGGEATPLTDLTSGKWLALSGLGRPGAFERTLAELGVANIVPAAFADRHAYTQAEIAAAAEQVGREGLAGIVTTEKDAVKIDPEWAGDTPVLVVEIDLEFRSGREDLEALVRERLRRRLETNGSRTAVPTADERRLDVGGPRQQRLRRGGRSPSSGGLHGSCCGRSLPDAACPGAHSRCLGAEWG